MIGKLVIAIVTVAFSLFAIVGCSNEEAKKPQIEGTAPSLTKVKPAGPAGGAGPKPNPE